MTVSLFSATRQFVFHDQVVDPVHVKEARIGPGGGLESPRRALYSTDGPMGERQAHAAYTLIRAASRNISSVTLSVPGDSRKSPPRTFAFSERDDCRIQLVFRFLRAAITVRYSPEGLPDDNIRQRTDDRFQRDVAKRYAFIRRMEVTNAAALHNSKIDGVPPFWEDQLFGEEERSSLLLASAK